MPRLALKPVAPAAVLAMVCVPIASAAPGTPTMAKTANVGNVGGTVLIKPPGSPAYTALVGDSLVPVGSRVDARQGRARVTVGIEGGNTNSAVFYGGVFKISQKRSKKPVAEMRLAGRLENCTPAKGSSAAQRKRKGRRLSGDGKGRFRIRGKRSSALVKGTIWLVEDRCDGSTLTRVSRGSVTVRDFAKRKDVTVKRGKRYVAKARKKKGRG